VRALFLLQTISPKGGIRMIKVRQKISGTFKNIDRASDFCSIRSYISTGQKQRKYILEALVNVFRLYSELNLGFL